MISTAGTNAVHLKRVRCDVKEGSYSKHMQAKGAAVCLFRSKHAGLSNYYHNHVLFQLSQGTMGFRRIMKEGKAEDVQGGKKIHMYVGKGGVELYFVSVVRFFFDAVRGNACSTIPGIRFRAGNPTPGRDPLSLRDMPPTGRYREGAPFGCFSVVPTE